MESLTPGEGLFTFFLVTIVLGGGSAWMTGRAIARTWDSLVKLTVYVFFLGCAVRFIHYALFEGTLFAADFFAVDLVTLFAIAFLAWAFTRARQMATQYGFAFRQHGPLGWGARDPG